MKKKSDPAGPVLRPRFRITYGNHIAFGPGKAELLALVADSGSIAKAAKRMNMSYMRAWSLIQEMNQCFKEPVVITLRGGQGRGGAELTVTGRRVLALYRQIEKETLRSIQAGWQELRELLRC